MMNWYRVALTCVMGLVLAAPSSPAGGNQKESTEPPRTADHAGIAPVDYDVELTKASSGFDGNSCWVHARAGVVPSAEHGKPPRVVMTTQKLLLTGSDVFYALNQLWSDDSGATWSPARQIDSFARQTHNGADHPLPTGADIAPELVRKGDETTVCDFVPMWHRKTGTLLGIGHTVWYRDNRVMHLRPRGTAYAVYNAVEESWSPWKCVKLPDEPRFRCAGAGSQQRFDLPNGDVLLPLYLKDPSATQYGVVVCRCTFDGATLTYTEHGNTLSIPVKRGLYEPSITKFGNRFYLTMRNDDHGYVSVSDDGLHFEPQKRWTFDDGADLGNYNTQQHWVTHDDGLFLVYTRKGADNDHVFRHRAPLFIAQVDPDRLHVIRSTERILVPERGARLGNFGVTRISPAETWVTVTEWMQPVGVEKHGSDNTIWVAKIKFKTAAEQSAAKSGLPSARPEDVGMDSRRLDVIDDVVAEGLQRGRMPGCVVLVGRQGRVVYHKAFGNRQIDPEIQPMSLDTVFDMASLTKPVATATSVMTLVERGLIDIDAPVARYIPEFGANGKDMITVKQLLTHTGGLIPDNSLKDYLDGPDVAFQKIHALDTYVDPGTKFVYTDVGFIVLAEVVQRVTGKNVHDYSRENVFAPLGMTETGYLPAQSLQQRAAVTQKRDGAWMRGEVHDPRAYALGGIAGHAGLFSTAADMARYAQMMINGGTLDNVQILKTETVGLMTAPVEVSSGLRTLGWDMRSPYSSNRGDFCSSAAFGHGGFTGTGMWIDPQQEFFVIFLSNRVHPDGNGSVNSLIGRIGTIAGASIRDSGN